MASGEAHNRCPHNHWKSEDKIKIKKQFVNTGAMTANKHSEDDVIHKINQCTTVLDLVHDADAVAFVAIST